MTTSDDQSIFELINQIYSVLMAPEAYDHFMDLWDEAFEKQLAEGEEADFSNLLEHLDRATQLMTRLSQPDEGEDPARVVEAYRQPALVVKASGDVVGLNEAARDLFGTPLHSLRDIGYDEREGEALSRALSDIVTAGAGDGARDGDGRFVTLSRETGQPLILLLQSLKDDPNLVLGRATGLVWDKAVGDTLQDAFGLSAAELDVVQGVALGQTLKEIADARGRSEQTVRGQIKSIFQRVGVKSQVELVRLTTNLLLVSDGRAFQEEIEIQSGPSSEPLTIPLAGGEQFSYRLYGKPEGRAFLFFHGVASGPIILPSFEEALVREGLQLVALDRPGYGSSSLGVGDTIGDDFLVRHFPDILNHLDLERIHLVTATGSIAQGTKCAVAYPERVCSILAVSGTAPLTSRDMLLKLPRSTRAVAMTARYLPAALSFLWHSGKRRILKDGLDDLLKLHFGEVEADWQCIAQPEMKAHIQDSVSTFSTMSEKALAVDTKAAFSDWSPLLEQLQCPVTFLVGRDDPIARHEWIASLAQHHEAILLHTVDGAGQLLIASHWPEVIGHLKAETAEY